MAVWLIIKTYFQTFHLIEMCPVSPASGDVRRPMASVTSPGRGRDKQPELRVEWALIRDVTRIMWPEVAWVRPVDTQASPHSEDYSGFPEPGPAAGARSGTPSWSSGSPRPVLSRTVKFSQISKTKYIRFRKMCQIMNNRLIKFNKNEYQIALFE